MKLSNSKLNAFRKCPRAYFYQYEARIEPQEEGESEHDRSFGSAIHEGIAVLYKGGMMAEAQEKFAQAYPVQLVEDDLEKTQEHGKVLIEAYWAKYQPTMVDWKVLDVEVLQEYEPIPGLVFRVKLDLIAENVKYGGIYGFDWKTTSKNLDYRYWAQFNPNAQISTYFDFISRKHGQCAGFYIDAMSFGHRQRAYKGQPAGFHYKLDRQLFSQTKDQLKDWLESEQEWRDTIEDKVAKSRWPMNTNSCQYCSYRPICAAGWSWENDKDLILCQFKKRADSTTIEESSDAVRE